MDNETGGNYLTLEIAAAHICPANYCYYYYCYCYCYCYY